MPEGPEIRRAADKIEAVLKDKTVEKIEFGLQPLQKFAKPLKGSRVLSLETRGKALLTHFDFGPYYLFTQPALRCVAGCQARQVAQDQPPASARDTHGPT